MRNAPSSLVLLTALALAPDVRGAQLDLFEVRIELQEHYTNNAPSVPPYYLESWVVGAGLTAAEVQPPGLGTLSMVPDGPSYFFVEEVPLGPTPHGGYDYTIHESGSSHLLQVVADPFAVGQGPVTVTYPPPMPAFVPATTTFQWNALTWTASGTAPGHIGVELYDVSAELDVAYAALDVDDTSWTPPTELVAGHIYQFEISVCDIEAAVPMQIPGTTDTYDYNQEHCYVNSIYFQVEQLPTPATHIAEFWPFWPGYSWHLFDASDPGNDELAEVQNLGPQYGQASAMELTFAPGEALVVHNDGTSVSWLGALDPSGSGPFLPNLLMGEFQDGDVVPWVDDEFVVLRRWEALDHSSQPASIPLGAQLPEVVALVWYDPGFGAPASSQSLNPFFESFGTSYPYGITEVYFLERGRGAFASADVDAGTGFVAAWRESIITMDCDANGIRDDIDILAGASDCNRNGVPDSCELAAGIEPDVDGNGILDRCEIVLNSDTLYVSAAAGATVQFDLSAPPALAGDVFLLLGSTSGAWPGIPLGSHTLPLVYDWYLSLTLRAPLGLLNPPGAGQPSAYASRSSVFPAGLPSALVGVRVEHAYVTVDPVTTGITGTSHAVPFLIVP